MERPHKIRLIDLNLHLTCPLCGGYFIDATTITECMHSFCKTCIIKYLKSTKYCPTCDVQVYKENPVENLRPDETLQDIVYKVVPGLFKNEMQSRKEFYKTCDGVATSLEDGGEDTSHLYTPDDAVSLSLSYFSIPPNVSERRYFCCPAAVKILHLVKLVRAKFGLGAEQRIEILFLRDVLNPELTLMEMMHVYAWRRRGPLHLSYCIVNDSWSKQLKYNHIQDNGSGYLPLQLMDTNPHLDYKFKSPISTDQGETVTIENILDCMLEKQRSEESSAKRKSPYSIAEHIKPLLTTESEWKEVQLQISESGIMSFMNVSCGTDRKDEAIGTREIKSLNTDSFPYIENITVDDTLASVVVRDVCQLSEKQLLQKNEKWLLNNNDSNRVNNNSSEISDDNSTLTTACQTIEQFHNNLVSSATCKIDEMNGKNNNDRLYVASEGNTKVNIELVSALSCTDKPIQRPSVPQGTNSVENDLTSQNRTTCGHLQSTECNDKKHDTKVDHSLTLTPKVDNFNATNVVKDVHPIFNTVNINSPGITQTSNDAIVSNSHSVSSQMPKYTGKEIHRTFSTLNNTHFPSKHSNPKREPPKMAIVAPTPSLLLANTAIKSNSCSQTVGNKTLKMPPRTWNPSIPRLSIPTTKYRSHPAIVDPRKYLDTSIIPDHRTVMSSTYNANSGSRVNNCDPVSPRYFKMRNMPRYLGNPSSGVKPMYQVASTAFNEHKQLPESSVKKPLQKVKMLDPSSTPAPMRPAETAALSLLPKGVTSTSSSSPELSSTNSSCSSPPCLATSALISTSVFQNQRNSDSCLIPNSSTFNFNHVSSSDYVSFADLCKTSAVSVGISQNASTHLVDTLPTSSNQSLCRSYSSNSIQAGISTMNHARNFPGMPSHVPSPVGPGAFHLLPPSVDMIFKPQHRIHSSGGNRYQCSTPAVQRVPATNSHVKNSPQTGNGSVSNNQRAQLTIIPSCISQTHPNNHTFVYSTTQEEKFDINKIIGGTSPKKTSPVSNQFLPHESSCLCKNAAQKSSNSDNLQIAQCGEQH